MSKPLTFGSLFAGVGGADLGFERAGMECRWQVEIDDYATRVLEKNWPNVRRHRDVRTFPPRAYEYSYSWRGMPRGEFGPDVKRDITRDEWGVDCIAGGPPCQPTSAAGKQLGESDARWLWPDALRVIDVLRPRIAVLENPTAITSLDKGRPFGRILARLASFGMDAEWFVLPAAAFGAPHIRHRTFICAYTQGMFRAPIFRGEQDGNLSSHAFSRLLADACRSKGQERQSVMGDVAENFTPAQRSMRSCRAWDSGPFDDGAVDDGLSSSVDQLDCYGNAIVPQVAEWIARRIIEAVGNN